LKCISTKPSYVPPELQQKKEKYDNDASLSKNPAYKSVNASQADWRANAISKMKGNCLIDLTKV
jgi:hypothetical protein